MISWYLFLSLQGKIPVLSADLQALLVTCDWQCDCQHKTDSDGKKKKGTLKCQTTNSSKLITVVL